MAALVEFLEHLLHTGKVVFRERPIAAPTERFAGLAVLQRAFRTFQLDVAGPALAFCPEVALAVAEFTRAACWYLVQHDEPADAMRQRLTLSPPHSPAEHLTGDLLLRYVPQVHRRAHALLPNDPLCEILSKVMREWPLSGVMADVAEGPLTPIEFGGHSGLWMLYAERLFHNPKADWLPTGPAREYVELVFRDQGQERSAFLRSISTEEATANS
jgi:MoxR-vWA-beta-propeller ternary system domain bpX4